MEVDDGESGGRKRGDGRLEGRLIRHLLHGSHCVDSLCRDMEGGWMREVDVDVEARWCSRMSV